MNGFKVAGIMLTCPAPSAALLPSSRARSSTPPSKALVFLHAYQQANLSRQARLGDVTPRPVAPPRELLGRPRPTTVEAG